MSGQNGNLSAIENHELSFGTAMKTKRGFGTGQAQSTSTCLGQNQKRFRIRVIDGAPVAQLDRASAFEAEGREFESLRARHFFPTCNFGERVDRHPLPSVSRFG